MIFLINQNITALEKIQYDIKQTMHTQLRKPNEIIAFGILFILTMLLTSPGIYSQVTADFIADDTLGCTPFTVHFTNTGSSGPEFDYLWTFGSLGTRTDENPVFTFFSPGDIPVTLQITNRNTLESDAITKFIYVNLTPNATLSIDSTNACVHGEVQFHVSSSIDSAYWNFGDGSDSTSIGNYMYHAYDAHGNYNVQCITYRYQCSDTSDYIVNVDGPVADFNFDPQEACKGSPVTFTIDVVSDVSNYSWDLGDGTIVDDENPVVTHSYDTMGYLNVELTVTGITGSCAIRKQIHLWEVIADFEVSDTRCHQQPVAFTNTSLGNNANNWYFGNGTTSMSVNPVVTYAAGTYTVKLVIENEYSCADSVEKEVVVNPLPEIHLMNDTIVCPGVDFMLEASGGHIIFWNPSSAFDNPTSYTPVIAPDSTSTYSATITDTITHCTNSDEVTITVQEGFIAGKITVFPLDTSLIVGDSVTVTVYDTLNRELFYVWTPDDRISCTDCPNPTMQPLHSSTYTLVVSDTNQCFQSEMFDIAIEVREEYRIGVPDAFTPNDDMINDIIRVDGWGIQELIEFRIYNRWGIEVFYTNDISEGWDGYYKGKLQNVDTYSYIIKAKMWDDNITTVQGTFSLLH